MTWALRVYFRNIDLRGIDRIPKKGPILFACNHPSSFMEACILACFQPRELHFLVRGDVFSIKWLRPLLIKTNQIPIFRFRDGFSKLKKNKNTFSATYEVLNRGGAVIIYPEGSTEMVKQLRPLQRGLARMAFGLLDEDKDHPLQVVPVGVNYSNVLKFRSDVSISIGAPIPVKEHYVPDEVVAERRSAVDKFTQYVYEAMKPHVVSTTLHDVGVGRLLRAAYLKSDNSPGEERFSSEWNMAQLIEKDTTFPSSEIHADSSELRLGENFDWGLTRYAYGMARLVLAILVSPLALIGLVSNYLPFFLSKKISEKKMKDREFVAPVRVASHLILQIIYTFLLNIILWFFIGPLSLAIWVVLPLLGRLTIWCWQVISSRVMRKRYSGELQRLLDLVDQSMSHEVLSTGNVSA